MIWFSMPWLYATTDILLRATDVQTDKRSELSPNDRLISLVKETVSSDAKKAKCGVANGIFAN